MFTEELECLRVRPMRVVKENIDSIIGTVFDGEDITNVPQPDLFALLDRYCAENCLPLIDHRIAGQRLRCRYKLNVVSVRVGDKVEKVYERRKLDIDGTIRAAITEDCLTTLPQPTLFAILDEYCEENGIQPISHRAAGRRIREMYGLESKSARVDGQVRRFYVKG